MKGTGKAAPKRAACRKKNYEDDDEDDEEYVAEEEDSSYESGSLNNESLDASYANDSASSAATDEEISNTKVKHQRIYSVNRRRFSESSDSDYQEWKDEDCEDEEDFEEDWEEDSLVLRGATKRKRTMLKSKASKSIANKRSGKVAPASRKRKRMRTAERSDDDDNFYNANDRKSHIEYSKKASKRRTNTVIAKKNKSSTGADSFDPDYSASDDNISLKIRFAVNNSSSKKNGCSRRRKKKIAKVDSDISDSDFVVSEEDLLDNDFIEFDRPRKKSRDERKPTRIDSDYEISEEEMNGLEFEETSNLRKREGLSAGKKGKVKEVDDSGKQLCGICLSEEHKGTIQGILNSCSHYFCFACIMEWSRVESRCPICKRRFVTITKASGPDSMLEMRKRVIRVQMRDQVYKPSEEELRVLLDPYEDVVCMECHLGGDDSLMLLCDICDSSAHTYCVGLGTEVPEGNWYCDCCKLAGEGSLHSQVVDAHGTSISFSHCDAEENGSNPQMSSNLRGSASLQGQLSSQGSDQNSLPRNFMEGSSVSASVLPGSGASTLQARRAIHQHIRIIFSNARPREFHAVSNRTDIASHIETDNCLVLEQNEEQFQSFERPNSMYNNLSSDQQVENSRDFPHSDSNLVQHPSNRGRNCIHVEGAKKKVQSMVKHYLKKLPREFSLDRSAFKKIARKATHTILASCGIHHSRSVISSLHEPPNHCSHDLGLEQLNAMTGCCPSCFSGYVKDVVKLLTETV